MITKYKGYIIIQHYSNIFTFQHDYYDGADDSNDRRRGGGSSIQDCINEIDEQIEMGKCTCNKTGCNEPPVSEDGYCLEHMEKSDTHDYQLDDYESQYETDF